MPRVGSFWTAVSTVPQGQHAWKFAGAAPPPPGRFPALLFVQPQHRPCLWPPHGPELKGLTEALSGYRARQSEAAAWPDGHAAPQGHTDAAAVPQV